VYHAQPRHCLQRISSPDHGQLRAPVLEPAGCGVRLDKRPLRSRVFDAGTIWSPVRTGSRNFTTEVSRRSQSPRPGQCLFSDCRAAASSLIAATTMQRRSSQPDLRDPEASICWPVEIRADWRPRRWVLTKMTGWVQIGSMFALRSLGTCAKRLKFLSWKGD
jgi:hypothetical protein